VRSLYAVRVDDQCAGVVDANGRAAVERFLDEAVRRAAVRFGHPVQVSQSVRITRVRADRLTPLSDVCARLRAALDLRSSGTAITIGGVPVVVVWSHAAAEGVVQRILDDYRVQVAAALKAEGGRVQRLDFDVVRLDETVTFDDGVFGAADVATPDEAERILLRGTDRIVVHVVKSGQSLWSIAQGSGLTVQTLIAANPSLENPNRLRVGDEINLVVPDPYVNLSSVETAEVLKGIPFPVQVVQDSGMWPWERAVRQAGQAGERLVTMRTTRRNGKVERREVLGDQVLRAPQVQVVAQGCRLIPNRGTGRLMWPVVGQLTSAFGKRRWDFHSGVDIAAPTGTPVYAADGGVVTTSGRVGSYGQMIMIDHGGGRVVTVYGHLSARLAQVGQHVEKGQVIGYVGSTGHSTGPHLHFEVRLNGQCVDPIALFRQQAGA